MRMYEVLSSRRGCSQILLLGILSPHIYSMTLRLQRGVGELGDNDVPVFVVSWTTPSPPAWPPPYFPGHVFRVFSILQGEYHVSFRKECAEN